MRILESGILKDLSSLVMSRHIACLNCHSDNVVNVFDNTNRIVALKCVTCRFRFVPVEANPDDFSEGAIDE